MQIIFIKLIADYRNVYNSTVYVVLSNIQRLHVIYNVIVLINH